MPKCAGCQAEIKWVKMKTGRMMPVDAARIKIVTDEGDIIEGWMPHWATCPQAKEFKHKG